jgi:hypothetical protein
VYIEPYAKSLALELHDNSIQLDTITDSGKIPFMPFLGVSPRNHSNVFQMTNRKSADGKVINWKAGTSNPRVSGSFWSYLRYEKGYMKMSKELYDALEAVSKEVNRWPAWTRSIDSQDLKQQTESGENRESSSEREADNRKARPLTRAARA